MARNNTRYSKGGGSRRAAAAWAAAWALVLRTLGVVSTAALAALLLAGCNRAVSGREAADATPKSPDAILKALENRRLIDLTHTFDQKTIYWPTARGFELVRESAGVTDKGYYYAANRFSAAEHGGTHLDAPIHFYKDRKTVDRVSLSQLMGEAAVIDVAKSCARDPNYQVRVDDFIAWERKHGRRLDNMIVLLNTGWSRRWPDRAKYLGTAERGPQAVAKLRFPGLHPVAARWLAHERKIKAVGIDTASIDYGRSTHFESHVTLFEKNVPAIENVANLDRLPAAGAIVIALPMKIGGGSGGPTRVVALAP